MWYRQLEGLLGRGVCYGDGRRSVLTAMNDKCASGTGEFFRQQFAKLTVKCFKAPGKTDLVVAVTPKHVKIDQVGKGHIVAFIVLNKVDYSPHNLIIVSRLDFVADAATGEQIWHQGLNVPVRAGPALTEDGGKLFVGAHNGTLYALDTADGFVLWSIEGKGQVLSPPVVSGSTVYETLIYGPQRIRAFHVDTGREIWAYPPAIDEE